MKTKLNNRQEKFCRLVAGGSSATAAYRKAGYESKDPDVAGPRLMGNVGVKRRLRELAKKTEAVAGMEREEMVRWLVQVVRGHGLEKGVAQVAVKEMPDGRKLVERRGPDRLRAAERLARMCGWDAADKVEVGVGDPLIDLLRSIRERKGGAA